MYAKRGHVGKSQGWMEWRLMGVKGVLTEKAEVHLLGNLWTHSGESRAQRRGVGLL